MPKVSRKERQQPLVEAAPVALDRQETGNVSEPTKPKFTALTAFEQSGRKVDFRRVRASSHGSCRALKHALAYVHAAELAPLDTLNDRSEQVQAL